MPHGSTVALSGAQIEPGDDIHDLVHGLDAIIWEVDAETRLFTFVSQRAEELLGYPIERWLSEAGYWANQIVHPDDRERVVERCLQVGESGSEHRVEYRALTSAGRVLWLRHLSRIVQHAPGVVRRRGIIFDITEQKRTEEALRRSESRFRLLVENISDIVAIIGADHTFRYISPAVEMALGYSAEEVLGRSSLDFVHPDHAAFLQQRTESRLLGEAEPTELTEVPIRHRNGTWRTLQIRGRRHEERQGEPVVILTARDVTERRLSEEELRRQRAYFARLFENAPEAIVLLDEADRVQRVN
jgi:PAS domain S-box-containing protein